MSSEGKGISGITADWNVNVDVNLEPDSEELTLFLY